MIQYSENVQGEIGSTVKELYLAIDCNPIFNTTTGTWAVYCISLAAQKKIKIIQFMGSI